MESDSISTTKAFLALSFFLLLLGCGTSTQKLAHNSPYLYDSGAVVRGDTTQKKLALVFTGDEFADGGNHIAGVLEKLQKLLEHLLYCDWQKRDSQLVSREEFQQDLLANYQAMESFGLRAEDAPLFLHLMSGITTL